MNTVDIRKVIYYIGKEGSIRITQLETKFNYSHVVAHKIAKRLIDIGLVQFEKYPPVALPTSERKLNNKYYRLTFEGVKMYNTILQDKHEISVEYHRTLNNCKMSIEQLHQMLNEYFTGLINNDKINKEAIITHIDKLKDFLIDEKDKEELVEIDEEIEEAKEEVKEENKKEVENDTKNKEPIEEVNTNEKEDIKEESDEKEDIKEESDEKEDIKEESDEKEDIKEKE